MHIRTEKTPINAPLSAALIGLKKSTLHSITRKTGIVYSYLERSCVWV